MMKFCLVLCFTVLAVSLTQASVTYRQLLQLAKPADDSVKADHEIQLGKLDDEVSFQSILKQMGHVFDVKESHEEEMERDFKQFDDFEGIKSTTGTNANLDESVNAGECACSGKECVCCCVMTFTYEGQRYYIELCGRITYVSSSKFYVELFLQRTKVHATYVTRTTNVVYYVNSALRVGCNVYYLASNRICFYLYFVVSGTTYKCSNHCLSVSASRFGMNLKRSDE